MRILIVINQAFQMTLLINLPYQQANRILEHLLTALFLSSAPYVIIYVRYVLSFGARHPIFSLMSTSWHQLCPMVIYDDQLAFFLGKLCSPAVRSSIGS